MLEEFRERYDSDFQIKELDIKTLKYRYIHPRLHLAFKSLMRDMDRLFVSLDYLKIIKKNINTSNRIECVFSHLKPKVKLHR
jgi:transposase-like protein